jgi:VanZ family protein
MRPLFVLLFWSAVVFALVMASLPKPPPIPLEPSDKVLHIVAFVVLAALGVLAYPAMRLLTVFLGLCLFGGLIELVQSVPGLNRDASLADWLADILAAAAVLLPVALFRHWRRRQEA